MRFAKQLIQAVFSRRAFALFCCVLLVAQSRAKPPLRPPWIRSGLRSAPEFVATSGNGRYLITFDGTTDRSVVEWDLQTGLVHNVLVRETGTLMTIGQSINRVVWSASHHLLAVLVYQHTYDPLIYRDTGSYSLLTYDCSDSARLLSSTAEVGDSRIGFSLDGQEVIFSTIEFSGLSYEVRRSTFTGQVTLIAADKQYRDSVLSDDGKRLFVSEARHAYLRRVSVYAVDSPEYRLLAQKDSLPDNLFPAELSPNLRFCVGYFAKANSGLSLQEVPDGNLPVRTIFSASTGLYSPVVCGLNDTAFVNYVSNTLTIFDLNSRSIVKQIQIDSEVQIQRIYPTGIGFLACVSRGNVVELRLLDIQRGVFDSILIRGYPRLLAASAAANAVLTTSDEFSVQVIDATTGFVRNSFRLCEKPQSWFGIVGGFGPTGSLLFATSSPVSVSAFDLVSGTLQHSYWSITGQSTQRVIRSFSTPCRFAFLVDSNLGRSRTGGLVVRYDLLEGRPTGTFLYPLSSSRYASPTFSPDGSYMAISRLDDAMVDVRSFDSAAYHRTYSYTPGYDGPFVQTRFSTDSRSIFIVADPTFTSGPRLNWVFGQDIVAAAFSPDVFYNNLWAERPGVGELLQVDLGQIRQIPMDSSTRLPDSLALLPLAVDPQQEENTLTAIEMMEDGTRFGAILKNGDLTVLTLPPAVGSGVYHPTGSRLSGKIFPNPADREVTVSLDADQIGPFAVRIIDMAGRECLAEDVFDLSTADASVTLSTSNLRDGVYTVLISYLGGVSSARLVVLHR